MEEYSTGTLSIVQWEQEESLAPSTLLETQTDRESISTLLEQFGGCRCPVNDQWHLCKSLCDYNFSQIEGIKRIFSHTELCISVVCGWWENHRRWIASSIILYSQKIVFSTQRTPNCISPCLRLDYMTGYNKHWEKYFIYIFQNYPLTFSIYLLLFSILSS